MDRTQKMLIGVLSVAGLIALVIPQKDPISQASNATVADEAPPPAYAPPPPPPPLPVQFDSGPAADFQIGAPTIDGKPMQPDFGLPFGASPQTSSPDGDASQASQNGYAPPAYTMPGAAPKIETGDAAATENNQGQ